MKSKTLDVVCAIIEKDGKILLGKRSAPRQHAGFWEFPGGKIDAGESAQKAVEREIMEELGVRVSVGKPLSTAIHEYETHRVRLFPFICHITEGLIQHIEYEEVIWVNPANKIEVPLLPPDYGILKEYICSWE